MHVTNFTLCIMLLMAFTVAMMMVRSKQPLENNWPMLYWLVVLFFSVTWPEDTWDYPVITVGAAAGLILRFEFMNNVFQKLATLVEVLVQVYILYFGLQRVTY